jgi:simple sugar transport system permease protein
MKNKAGCAVSQEPFVRMVKRDTISRGKAIFIRGAAVLGALMTGGLIMLALGHNPFVVYADMLVGSLGSKTTMIETIRITPPFVTRSAFRCI